MGYKQQVKPIFERLLGQLELALLGGMEEEVSIRTETEWATVECPAIARLFVNKQREFARLGMDAANHDEAVGVVMNLKGRGTEGRPSKTRKRGVYKRKDMQYTWRSRTRSVT